MRSGLAGRRPEKPRPRILVIEDDPGIAALVAYQLTRDGYRVETASAGDGGLNSLHGDIPDLVVLDRMLPGLSGDEVLRSIRRDPATRSVPVIVLTAKREEDERIEGLELGADDYLTKPFSPRELVLRVQAILKRARLDALEPGGGGRVIESGPLKLNLSAKQATVDGEPVALTPTEYRLLKALMERLGQTCSRDDLLREIRRGDRNSGRLARSRTVDMHMRRMRVKLGRVGGCIETVRGFGYRLRGPER